MYHFLYLVMSHLHHTQYVHITLNIPLGSYNTHHQILTFIKLCCCCSKAICSLWIRSEKDFSLQILENNTLHTPIMYFLLWTKWQQPLCHTRRFSFFPISCSNPHQAQSGGHWHFVELRNTQRKGFPSLQNTFRLLAKLAFRAGILIGAFWLTWSPIAQ